MKVSFKLAEGFSALRHTLSGGRELQLDGAGTLTSDDPTTVAALDAHPAAVRVKAPKKPRAPRQPTKKVAVSTAAEEGSA